jgi:hypothetical protein
MVSGTLACLLGMGTVGPFWSSLLMRNAQSHNFSLKMANSIYMWTLMTMQFFLVALVDTVVLHSSIAYSFFIL